MDDEELQDIKLGPQETKIKKLPADTVRRIKAEQVVTDVDAAVKELLDLDAGATTVRIHLSKQGLDTITVEDNGSGIARGDFYSFGQPHHTSKLANFSELDTVLTYGFRGEGFSSLSFSKVKVWTKTINDDNITLLQLDKKGQVTSKTTSDVGDPQGTKIKEHGTKIQVKGIFMDLPVRRQTVEKKIKNATRRIHNMIHEYSLIAPHVKIIYEEPPKPNIIKKSLPDTKSVLQSIFPEECLQLHETKFTQDITENNETTTMHVHCFLPKRTADASEISKSTNERMYIYVNHRPIDLLKLTKVINAKFRAHFRLTSKSYPFVFVHIQIDTHSYDVNISPNKRTIKFHQEVALVKKFEEMLEEFYPTPLPPLTPTPTEVGSRQNFPAEETLEGKEEEPLPDANREVVESAGEEEKTEEKKREEGPPAKRAKVMTALIDMADIKMRALAPPHKRGDRVIESIGPNDIDDCVMIGKLKQTGHFVVRFGPPGLSNVFLFDSNKAVEAITFHQLLPHHHPFQNFEPLPMPLKVICKMDDSVSSVIVREAKKNGMVVELVHGGLQLRAVTSDLHLNAEDARELVRILTLKKSSYLSSVISFILEKDPNKTPIYSPSDAKTLLQSMQKERNMAVGGWLCPHGHDIFTKIRVENKMIVEEVIED
ncbi:hypothetical protein PROFUN_06149 [Planoprotostelium fungivorum]|uniref:DNA mismatch repair protein S5 domain-containing protein n=1 Tax=Planoprotostelium fungivorum TaxID=1890364 RepID=A0A2P6NPJ3_9EUKA|nr:hypothetical protein PROFUN_06149 [Planoprotostelium fungivorum]